MKRRVYFIPRYVEDTGGTGWHWLKLRHKDLLSRQGWKKMTLTQKGAWIHLFMIADRKGLLRNGILVFKDKDIAKELNCKLSTWKRIAKRLMSSEINFLGTFVIQIDNHQPPVGTPKDDQRPPNGKAKPVGTGSNRINYPIDIDKDKKRKDKSTKFSQEPFFRRGVRIKALTNRYRDIKKNELGIVVDCHIHFKKSSIHQEQVRENPHDWEVVDAKKSEVDSYTKV